MSSRVPVERSLSGKNAIILGGAGAIGVAIAAELLRDGADVLLVDRSRQNLDDAVARLVKGNESRQGAVHTFVGDALSEIDVQSAVRAVAGQERRLSMAVSVVGGGDPAGFGPAVQVEYSGFNATMTMNVKPAFLLLKYATEFMLPHREGSLTIISSVSAVLSAPLMSAYSAGKAALEALVRTAADELGSFGVRVNAVRPGFTQNQATAQAFASPGYKEAYLAEQALKRTGAPEDVASAVRFLSGPESGWITGQCINVDGGLTLHRIPKRQEVFGGIAIPPNWRDYLG